MTVSRYVQILAIGLTLGPAAATLLAEAQPPRPAARPSDRKIPRVGVLSTSTQSSPPITAQLEAFRQGLRELGYVEGESIAFEYRSAEGNAALVVNPKTARTLGFTTPSSARARADLVIQ